MGGIEPFSRINLCLSAFFLGIGPFALYYVAKATRTILDLPPIILIPSKPLFQHIEIPPNIFIRHGASSAWGWTAESLHSASAFTHSAISIYAFFISTYFFINYISKTFSTKKHHSLYITAILLCLPIPLGIISLYIISPIASFIIISCFSAPIVLINNLSFDNENIKNVLSLISSDIYDYGETTFNLIISNIRGIYSDIAGSNINIFLDNVIARPFSALYFFSTENKKFAVEELIFINLTSEMLIALRIIFCLLFTFSWICIKLGYSLIKHIFLRITELNTNIFTALFVFFTAIASLMNALDIRINF